MRKENVFIVSGRQTNGMGDAHGPVFTYVLCAADEEAMKELAKKRLPNFVITSETNLAVLDQTSMKVKSVLAGQDTSWSVLVQPGLVGA